MAIYKISRSSADNSLFHVSYDNDRITDSPVSLVDAGEILVGLTSDDDGILNEEGNLLSAKNFTDAWKRFALAESRRRPGAYKIQRMAWPWAFTGEKKYAVIMTSGTICQNTLVDNENHHRLPQSKLARFREIAGQAIARADGEVQGAFNYNNKISMKTFKMTTVCEPVNNKLGIILMQNRILHTNYTEPGFAAQNADLLAEFALSHLDYDFYVDSGEMNLATIRNVFGKLPGNCTITRIYNT